MSTFSPKLIIDILNIKHNQNVQIDLNPDLVNIIRNIRLPQITQAELKQVQGHIQNKESIEALETALNQISFNFVFNATYLNQIGDLSNDNSVPTECLSLIVMYSYISWILHIHSLGSIYEVKPLFRALLFVTNSEFSNILKQIAFSIVSSFCQQDEEMHIYELISYIWEYVSKYHYQELIIPIFEHLLKNKNDQRYTEFLDELIQHIDLQVFSDESLFELLFKFGPFFLEIPEASLDYLIKISSVIQKDHLSSIIPFFPQIISASLRLKEPIQLADTTNTPFDYYRYSSQVPIGEFELLSIETLPGGFDPSFSINFPKSLNLATFFAPSLTVNLSKIAATIQNDNNLINLLLITFFEEINKNVFSNSIEFNLALTICLLYICSEISRLSDKPISLPSDTCHNFFSYEIFNRSISCFTQYQDYEVINTLRKIALEFILYDDGISIDQIFVSDASNYPNFMAELFFRLPYYKTLFSHCIENNQRLIKTIMNLALIYQHLETDTTVTNKEPIRNARISIFVTLAHLFSDSNMLHLFFQDQIFLNSFFVFLFEDNVKHFVLSTLTLYLSSKKIEMSNDIPTIFYRVLNLLSSYMTDKRQLLLLHDILTVLNSSVAYRQNDFAKFTEISKILCTIIANIPMSQFDKDLCQKIYKQILCFLISTYFKPSELEIDALISGLLILKDDDFLDSIHTMIVSLLAGQMIAPKSYRFIVMQPSVFRLLIQVYSTTSKLNEILQFIYNVLSFSAINLEKSFETDLACLIIKYLEYTKTTGQFTEEEVRNFLDIYFLLSIKHSSIQSVFTYISLLAPIESNQVSKYHSLFIDMMDNTVIEASKLPRSTFPLNGKMVQFAQGDALSEIVNGFTVTFWIFLEQDLECKRIFTLKLGKSMKIGLLVSNGHIFLYQKEETKRDTTLINENISKHTWAFCCFSFRSSGQRFIIQYHMKEGLTKNNRNKIVIRNFSMPFEVSHFALKLGGNYKLSSDNKTEPDDIPDANNHNYNKSFSRLGAFGLFKFTPLDEIISVASLGLRNNSTLTIPSLFYISDYSKFDETVHDGFFDILTLKCGVNSLLPLFIQNDLRTFDNKSQYNLSLEVILNLFMNVLSFSTEGQTNFFRNKGFNIIAQLLADRWTPYFTINSYNQLYHLLLSIQSEPLQQQIFDEVMTNFTFLQMLNPDLHFRIVKHWPSLFSSFPNIAINFSSVEDIFAVLRLFYWYEPIEKDLIKYVELRSNDLAVNKIRQVFFNLLFNYASESFKLSHFDCIIGHCISCEESQQVEEMISFLIKVFNETPDSVQFKVECNSLTSFVHYFISYPIDQIRELAFSFFIGLHQLKFISDEFFQRHIDIIINIFPAGLMNQSFFDFLISKLDTEPLLLNLCCYLAIHFKNASFMKNRRVKLHASPFWAIMPLYVCIYIDLSVIDFIIDCGIDDLCDIFTQYDVFFDRSPLFEQKFADKLLEINKEYARSTDLLELCKRIILFSSSKQPRSIQDYSFSLFNQTKSLIKANKLDNKNGLNDDNQLKELIFSKPLQLPNLRFHVQFDQNNNWCHSKLAELCLTIFEKDFHQSFLAFDLLLCSFLQTTDFTRVPQHLDKIEINDKNLTESESVIIPLFQYHTIQSSKEQYNIVNHPYTRSSLVNPLLQASKFDQLLKQMTPNVYLKKLYAIYYSFQDYQKTIRDSCLSYGDLNNSKCVISSVKQLKEFLERQKFQNDMNMRSWLTLWSSLSVERAPWHIKQNSSNLLYCRDISACYALAPVKMHKVAPIAFSKLSKYEEHNPNSFSKRGIMLECECNLISIEECETIPIKKKSIFRLFISSIIIQMLDKPFRKCSFTLPLSSLTYVFQRPNNGVHLFTESGYSFHLEFNVENHEKVLKVVYQNLKNKPSKKLVLFQRVPNKPFFQLLPYMTNWINGKLSNYEYLLMINHCAGRSFNDLNSYPIFPSLFDTFDDDKFDKIRTFKSMENKNRNVLPKCAVVSYLHAIEPFKQMSPSHTEFKAMKDIVHYSNENSFEFIPEIYSMPEIFNSENSALFVYHHRKALESQSVTQQLNIWIDNIFGAGSPNELFDNNHPTSSFYTSQYQPAFRDPIEIQLEVNNIQAATIKLGKHTSSFVFAFLCENSICQFTIMINNSNNSFNEHQNELSSTSSNEESSINIASPNSYDELNANHKMRPMLYDDSRKFNLYNSGMHFSFTSADVKGSVLDSNELMTARSDSKDGGIVKQSSYSSSGIQYTMSQMKVFRLINRFTVSNSSMTSIGNKFYITTHNTVSSIDIDTKRLVVFDIETQSTKSTSLDFSKHNSPISNDTTSQKRQSYSNKNVPKKITEINNNNLLKISVDGDYSVIVNNSTSITLIHSVSNVSTIQFYCEEIIVSAVSITFHTMAFGTKNGSLVICSTTTNKLVRIVALSQKEQTNELKPIGYRIYPHKIIITPSWGFIAVHYNEIISGVKHYFVSIFTINGELIRRVEISTEIDFWYCWTTYSGFDYIAFASNNGRIAISEVFYFKPQIIYNSRAKVVGLNYDQNASTLIFVMNDGKIVFLPIVCK